MLFTNKQQAVKMHEFWLIICLIACIVFSIAASVYFPSVLTRMKNQAMSTIIGLRQHQSTEAPDLSKHATATECGIVYSSTPPC